MQYFAKSSGNRSFEVADERQQPIGSLSYTAWSPNKAELTTSDNNRYYIAPTGFWRTKVGITKSDMPYAELKVRAMGKVVLSFENGTSFSMKRRSLWDSTDILTGNDEQEIASIKATFKWNTLSFSYDINVQAAGMDKELATVLPLILVYCSRYIRMRQSAVH